MTLPQLESQQVYKIDNKTPKVEKILFARVNQPIKTWDKTFLKLSEQKCKVEEQISQYKTESTDKTAKHNSQFLLLPSTLRIRKPKIFKEISVLVNLSE